MPQSGLWIGVGDDLIDAVGTSIATREEFSTTVPARTVKPRKAEVALISLQGDLQGDAGLYLGISNAGRSAGIWSSQDKSVAEEATR